VEAQEPAVGQLNDPPDVGINHAHFNLIGKLKHSIGFDKAREPEDWMNAYEELDQVERSQGD